MFATIGRTWDLAKRSWSVLMRDKELLLFPLMTVVGVLAVVGVFSAIGASAGSFDRLDAAEGEEGVNLLDVVVLVLGAVAMTFVGIFFNSALIAAAIERLRGGDPNVRSGLKAVLPYTHNILGWSIIAASVGLILQLARSNTDNFLGRIALAIVGGIWAYMTFFVVPFLVVRGLGPVGAIKESAGLFKRTWGEQVTANFGFGIFYLVAGLIVFVPSALIFAASPVAGIGVGVILGVLAFSTVAATEGIFKAALFEYAAEGVIPQGFEGSDLPAVYEPKQPGGRGWTV